MEKFSLSVDQFLGHRSDSGLEPEGGQMARKRYTVEQIIGKLREAEIELGKGAKTPQVCRKLGISENTY